MRQKTLSKPPAKGMGDTPDPARLPGLAFVDAAEPAMRQVTLVRFAEGAPPPATLVPGWQRVLLVAFPEREDRASGPRLTLADLLPLRLEERH